MFCWDFHHELFCFSLYCCSDSSSLRIVIKKYSVICNSPCLKLETEFLSRRITFISINESLIFISTAKCSLPFIHYDMLNPETAVSAKNIISPLSTFVLQGHKHVCSFTSALIKCLLFPSLLVGWRAWDIWTYRVRYPETICTPPNTGGFWFWHCFSSILPQMKGYFTKSPCHLAGPTYLHFSFSQLHCGSQPRKK